MHEYGNVYQRNNSETRSFLFKYLDDRKIYGKCTLGLNLDSQSSIWRHRLFAAVCGGISRVNGKSKYSSPSVIRTIWGEGGPNYSGIRITEGKLRGIGNIQKIITQC
jgi:hypothetical protein